MRFMTIASIAASAVLGIGAVFLARGVIKGGPPRQAVAAAPARVQTVPVVIAAHKISFGEALKPRLLKLVDWPRDRAPEGAFSSLEPFAAQNGVWRSALARMAANEPVLAFKVSGEGQRQSLSSHIGTDKRAFAVRIDQASGAGGFILPGDMVDVVLVRNLNGEGNKPNMASDLIVQNVKVLGIDQNADATSDKARVGKTATIEVSIRDAQRLALAVSLGDLTLILRRAGAADLARTGRVSVADLHSVSAPSKKYRRHTKSLAVAVIRPGQRQMVRVLAARPAPVVRQMRTFADIEKRLEGGGRP